VGRLFGAEILKLMPTFLQEEVKFGTALNCVRLESSGRRWEGSN